MLNMYEIFDEFEKAKNKADRMLVIQKHLSPILVDILLMTYHPEYKWYFSEMPDEYKIPATLPGISFSHLGVELRKLYLFQKGNATADALTHKRRTELLIQLLESLEPREAEVVIGIFKKDLGVKGLNYNFVKEAFPTRLP